MIQERRWDGWGRRPLVTSLMAHLPHHLFDLEYTMYKVHILDLGVLPFWLGVHDELDSHLGVQQLSTWSTWFTRYTPWCTMPNMPNTSSGVSLKRSCKMQFSRIDFVLIGPPTKKLWPNQILVGGASWKEKRTLLLFFVTINDAESFKGPINFQFWRSMWSKMSIVQ